MNQIVATKTIERQWGNMDIQIAENGQEAIELLQKEHFDLVLMDIQMPVMDGYEATAFIRQEMPHLAGLPILAMTAHAHVAKDENIRKQGFNRLRFKTFQTERFVAKDNILFKSITLTDQAYYVPPIHRPGIYGSHV